MDVWLCFFAGLYRPLRSSKYQLSLHIVSEISTDLHQVLVTRSLFFAGLKRCIGQEIQKALWGRSMCSAESLTLSPGLLFG